MGIVLNIWEPRSSYKTYEKCVSGKYTLVCTCLKWQADFDHHTFFLLLENSTNNQKYVNKAPKFKIILVFKSLNP